MTALCRAISIGLAVAFPFFLWFIGQHNSNALALYLLFLGAIRFLSAPKSTASKDVWMSVLPASLGIAVLLLGSSAGLLYPAIVNGGFLVIFYLSLSTPKSVIQLLAEKVEKAPLSPVKIRYTKNLTRIWCAFFICNILISSGLALAGMVDLWTLYNGLVAYVLMIMLLLVERLLRPFIEDRMTPSSQ